LFRELFSVILFSHERFREEKKSLSLVSVEKGTKLKTKTSGMELWHAQKKFLFKVFFLLKSTSLLCSKCKGLQANPSEI